MRNCTFVLSWKSVLLMSIFYFQGPPGAIDCEQAPPLGSPDNLHRVDQEPDLQVLVPRVCPLRPGDTEAVRVRGQELYGGQPAQAGD